MKVCAFVSNRYDFFDAHFHNICKQIRPPQFEIGYFDFWTRVQKMGKDYSPKRLLSEFESFSESADIVWCYTNPDTLIRKSCAKRGIVCVTTEGMGHKPTDICCLFPLWADFSPLLPKEPPKYAKRPLRITLTIADAFSPYDTVGHGVALVEKKQIPLSPKFSCDFLSSSNWLLYEAVLSCFLTLSSQWELAIRLNPRYPHLNCTVSGSFEDFVTKLNHERVVIDKDPVEISLAKTALVICLCSNFGMDALRAGCEVLSYNAHAHYANPLLTHNPGSFQELFQTLTSVCARIEEKGVIVNPLLPILLEKAKTDWAVRDGTNISKVDTMQLLSALKATSIYRSYFKNWFLAVPKQLNSTIVSD